MVSNRYKKTPRTQAFSLVELSIVLVILGLLTGGILAGQSLIRAAELRAISTEYARHLTATRSFLDKYFELPGDFTRATEIWGAAHTTPANCPTTVGTGTQTCNGNGNNRIETIGTGGNQYTEDFTFWQQLANAGLIEGTYTGRAGPVDISHGTYDNTYRSKFMNAVWSVHNYNASYSGQSLFDGAYLENMFQLGVPTSSGGGTPAGSTLKPEELWNIDTKMDDGKPARGAIRARYWASCTNAANSAALDADYLLSSNNQQGCTGWFYLK